MKRLSNKCSKNNENNKFNKILHLQREKVKGGFEKYANFEKIAKVTRIFPTMWKDWATNVAKITRITNLTKYYTYKEKRSRRALVSPQFRRNRKSNKNCSCYVKRLSNKYGKNSKNNKFNRILPLESEKGKERLEIWLNATNWLVCYTHCNFQGVIITPLVGLI